MQLLRAKYQVIGTTKRIVSRRANKTRVFGGCASVHYNIHIVSDLQKCAEGEIYPHWYILTLARANDKTHTELERRVMRFNQDGNMRGDQDLDPSGNQPPSKPYPKIGLFAPTYVEMRRKGSHVTRIRKPLTCNYIFLRSTLTGLRCFRSLYSDYNLIRNRAGEGYLTVTDHELENFRRVAMAYGNNMPCFKPDETELQKGDKVKILDGPFKDVEGYLVTKKGKDGGRVVISISGLMAVETIEIAPEYLQVIEFAKGSKHIYDKLDSFEPRLRQTISTLINKRSRSVKKSRSGQEKGIVKNRKDELPKLNLEEAAPLDYFLRRFGEVKVDAPKTAARLECLLMAAAAFAGRTEEMRLHKERFLQLLPSVTNRATRLRLLSLHALTTLLT